ncbi:MAG: hydantoinase/oxoprolinase family protein [Acidimicrobiia bacterium]|nr:hydantoinase/oxoprolinase family protein [Acidimicrobiia bacterium]
MDRLVAVDSGGTFTDCVVLDAAGRVTTAKAPSTPSDFSEGVVQSVSRAAVTEDLDLRGILHSTTSFCHGTTVATNALLTRSGSVVGLVTTKGHEDAIIVGRTIQKAAGLTESELSNLAYLEKAVPVVPRPLIRGVTERIDYRGSVVVPVDVDEAARAADELVDAGVEAIAVCFLWSFMNPDHERAVAELIRSRHPDLLVTVSHEVAPVIKEYERCATTVLNGYLSGTTHAYISKLQERLADGGLATDPVIMQSIGGVSSAEASKGRAVALLGSGPTGGVFGAAALGRLIGADNIVTTDVGGTSFDVGLVVDGEPLVVGTPVFDKYHTVLPVIDVTSIGAGGGSLAWIEPGTGLIKVGPQSAGAVPGPACYGIGGTLPTVTDANLVLGRLDPDYFLGGERRLHTDLATDAIRAHVAEPAGLPVTEAAMAIVDILDARMADLVRTSTIGRGYDPREFALFAFGGAGPLHVGAYAADVGTRLTVVPTNSAVFSAFGIAASDPVAVVQASDPMVAPFDSERLEEIYVALAAGAVEELGANGVAPEDITTSREVEMRYRGQVHEVRVPVPDGPLGAESLAVTMEEFRRRYNRRYGSGAAADAAIEARTFVVRGVGRQAKPELRPAALSGEDPSPALVSERQVYFRPLGGFVPAPIYRRELLVPGNAVGGHAIVEAVDTTMVIHPGQRAEVDAWGNILLDTSGGRR